MTENQRLSALYISVADKAPYRFNNISAVTAGNKNPDILKEIKFNLLHKKDLFS